MLSSDAFRLVVIDLAGTVLSFLSVSVLQCFLFGM